MGIIIDAGRRTQDAGRRTQDAGRRTQDAGVIHCLMAGRLGNNLFSYAFARALQIKFYPDYEMLVYLYYQLSVHHEESVIRCFNINGVKYIEDMPQNIATSFQRKLMALRDRFFAKLANIRPRRITSKIVRYCDTHILQRIYNKFGLYNPLGCSVYAKPIRSSFRNIYCSSFFENPRYFEDIRDTLLEELQPRNGDFLKPKIAGTFHVCTEEYFAQAMKEIRAEVPDCKFFVFSDDVEYESANNPSYESLRLMYSCKHFIISNSTFSWWAQYLGRNPNKIVYIPSPWHWHGEKWEDFYLPYMRIIKCHKQV